MDGFDWAQNNLGVSSPHELQDRGVNVYFAPNIAAGTKLVDLGDRAVRSFREAEHRPRDGYYAAFDDLARYCIAQRIPLVETNGEVTVQPVELGEAGNPLQHGAP